MPEQDTTKKERLWLLPDSRKNEIRAGLYMVATPIGNLGDISLRALDTLAAVDLIACEDTRVTKKLISYYGISKPLISYNDHNADKQRSGLIEKVAAGKAVALVSDAGTPMISDPGYKLAREALAAGLYVTALPGANAPLTALQLSGQPSDKFCFLGFLPPKAGAREKVLREWQGVAASLIVFESASRLVKTLGSIRSVMGEREVAVVREITKMFEESRRASVSDLIAHYEEHGDPKGEIVLVIAPADAVEADEADLDALLRAALQDMSTKEAAAHVAAQTGLPRKELYSRALGLYDKG